MIKSAELEFSNGKLLFKFINLKKKKKGRMVESTLENGKMVNSTEKGLFIHLTTKRKKENGRMDRGKDGLFLKMGTIKNKSQLN